MLFLHPVLLLATRTIDLVVKRRRGPDEQIKRLLQVDNPMADGADGGLGAVLNLEFDEQGL
jgi:hypothetical protein